MIYIIDLFFFGWSVEFLLNPENKKITSFLWQFQQKTADVNDLLYNQSDIWNDHKVNWKPTDNKWPSWTNESTRCWENRLSRLKANKAIQSRRILWPYMVNDQRPAIYLEVTAAGSSKSPSPKRKHSTYSFLSVSLFFFQSFFLFIDGFFYPIFYLTKSIDFFYFSNKDFIYASLFFIVFFRFL